MENTQENYRDFWWVFFLSAEQCNLSTKAALAIDKKKIDESIPLRFGNRAN